jgi:hypothetical protein
VGFVTFWGILCVCYAKECEVKGSNARMFCEIKIVWDAILNLKLCENWPEMASNCKIECTEMCSS